VGQFFDLFKVFNCGKRLKGDKIAIVSISGGAGVVLADECEEVGMKVVDFAPETESTLSGLLPNFGSEKNPVDLTAQVLGHSEGWYRSIKCVADDPNTDAVVVFIGLLEHMKDELIPPLVKINSETDKPILVTWMACDEAIRKDFGKNGIPLYEEPHRCVYALSMLNKYRSLQETQAEHVNSPVSVNVGEVLESTENVSGVLDEVTSKKILARAGLPIANEVLITSREDAPAALDQVNGRAVMKVVSRDLPHKSDVGGVVLNIREPEKATRAFDQIMHNVRLVKPDANIIGVLVSEMVDSDLEMLVGLKNDPVFGPVIMTGLGGVFVEIFQDVSTRVLPIGKWDAHSMLKELKAYPLLLGVRGGRKKDIEAVVDTLVRVGSLGMSLGAKLSEMDINPLMIMSEGEGVKAVDALISLK
jgi:acetyltransferase